MVVELPKWFRDKYSVELNSEKEIGRYWIELNDVLRLLGEQSGGRSSAGFTV